MNAQVRSAHGHSLRISPDLILPRDAVTETFAILAKRGVGKTYTALVLVEELLNSGAQVIVADPVGVTWGLRAAANGKDPGLPIIVMGGDHGDIPLEAGAGKVIAEFIVDTRSSVVLDLSLLRKGDQIRFMTDFAEVLYHRNRAPLHLVLDEADAFAPQRALPDQARMLGAVQDLVRRGRARGIGVTLVTQRAAVLSKDVLTQVEVLIALRTIAPQDREAIDAWIQAHDAHGQRAEFMASLASLPIGTAWFWSPGWLDVFKRVRVRERETFDSSATPKVGTRPAAPKRLAEVDLEQLKTRIAATIEKAKAEDPRELRRRIQELERALQQRPAAAAPAKAVEIEVVKPATVKALERAIDRLDAAIARAHGHVEGAHARHGELVLVRDEIVREFRRLRIGSPEAKLLQAVTPHLKGTSDAELQRRTASVARVLTERRQPVSVGDITLGAGELRMLGALRLRHPTPLTKQQLGLLSGYAPGGGTFRTYLPRLRAARAVDVRGDLVDLTARGLELAPDAGAAPRTPDEVRRLWLEALGQGPRRMLEVLIGAYPREITREELGRASGYEAGGGTFRTYLPKLKRLRLVENHGGHIRAAEELFG